MTDATAVAHADDAKPSQGADVGRARALVLEHFHRIFRVLRRFGMSEPDASDAAQQVFLIATSRLDEIPKERERAFLYGAALRIASTARRDRRRRDRWVDLGYEDSLCEAPAADEQLERYEALALLDHVLADLPEDLRAVFVLCEIEELTGPEVAELLGIAVGTVASRLARARRQFDDRAARMRAAHERQP